MCCATKNLMRAALAVAVIFVGAVPAYAQGLGFRNELKGPVIVQGASTNGIVVRHGPPILIQPGKVGWDNKLPPGIRLITIRDATRPNLILLTEQVKFDGRDIGLIIQMQDNKIVLKPYLPGAPGN